MPEKHIPQFVQDANSIVTDHVVSKMQEDITKPDGLYKVISWIRWLLYPDKPSEEYTKAVIESVKNSKKT